MKNIVISLVLLTGISSFIAADPSPEIFDAVKKHESNRVKELLARGGSVNALNEKGESLLLVAVQNAEVPADVDMVGLLLDKGADPNILSHDGTRPLLVAIGKGNISIVNMLLAKKADVLTKTPQGYTPQMIANASNKHAIADLLAEAANAQRGAATGENVELFQAINRHEEQRVKDLIEKGASVDSRDRNKSTALLVAVANADTLVGKRIVEFLLSKGADVNAILNDGRTVLMYAATEGNGDMVRLLLAHKADARKKDSSGRTAFSMAKGGTPVAKMLWEAEQAQEAKSKNDQTQASA